MDPGAVLKTLWRQKLVVVPLLLVTLAGCAYAAVWGPRIYESTASYVIITPKVPTDLELEKNPKLAALNSDNPYLRSSDPTLAGQVVTAKLMSKATADMLASEGLGRNTLLTQVVPTEARY